MRKPVQSTFDIGINITNHACLYTRTGVDSITFNHTNHLVTVQQPSVKQTNKQQNKTRQTKQNKTKQTNKQTNTKPKQTNKQTPFPHQKKPPFHYGQVWTGLVTWAKCQQPIKGKFTNPKPLQEKEPRERVVKPRYIARSAVPGAWREKNDKEVGANSRWRRRRKRNEI